MSKLLSSVSVLVLLAACGDDGKTFTYTLDAEIVVPEDVARSLATPAVVEVGWLGEPRQIALVCEPLEGELRVDYEDTVETYGHVSNQSLIARVSPWPADVPCDEALLDTFSIRPDGDVPYAVVTVFEDEVGPLGIREKDRAESVTVELAYQD